MKRLILAAALLCLAQPAHAIHVAPWPHLAGRTHARVKATPRVVPPTPTLTKAEKERRAAAYKESIAREAGRARVRKARRGQFLQQQAEKIRLQSAMDAAAMAGSGSGSVHVRGYTRSNGTYVQPYTRRAPGR